MASFKGGLAAAILLIASSSSIAAADSVEREMHWRIGGLENSGPAASCAPLEIYDPPSTFINHQLSCVTTVINDVQKYECGETFDFAYPYWFGQKQPGYTELNFAGVEPYYNGYGEWSVYDYSACTLEEAKDYIENTWTY